MRRYVFGYLFVRFAKIIAILILIVTVCGSVIRFWQGSLEAASVRYDASRSLESRLLALSEATARTQRLLDGFPGASPRTSISSLTTTAPTDEKAFKRMDSQLSSIRGDIESLKECLVHDFDVAVGTIESKLRGHASAIAQELAASQPAAEPDSPTPAPPSMDEPPPTLFTNLDRSEFALRRGVFQESNELLTALKSTAESPENEKVLKAAMQELERLEHLLPATLESVPAPQLPEGSNNSVQPAPKLNAERVADKLREVRRLIRYAVLANWAVDSAFDDAWVAANEEFQLWRDAGRSVKRIWLNVGLNIGQVLLGGVLISFLILVCANLTEALLDAATNSGIVAAVYQNAASPEAE